MRGFRISTSALLAALALSVGLCEGQNSINTTLFENGSSNDSVNGTSLGNTTETSDLTTVTPTPERPDPPPTPPKTPALRSSGAEVLLLSLAAAICPLLVVFLP